MTVKGWNNIHNVDCLEKVLIYSVWDGVGWVEDYIMLLKIVYNLRIIICLLLELPI